jgi:hypothetical protein
LPFILIKKMKASKILFILLPCIGLSYVASMPNGNHGYPKSRGTGHLEGEPAHDSVPNNYGQAQSNQHAYNLFQQAGMVPTHTAPTSGLAFFRG